MTVQKNTQGSQKWPLTLFTIGVFMAGLDNGIISTALSTINASFGVSPSWGAWTITLYTLGIAISVPIIGKLSDRFGRKRLFLIEITIFGIGSLLVAMSPNFTFLLASRLIQAIGGGGIFIIGSSHILATLPKEKQGKALGILGGMNGLAAVIGPNLGAIILDLTGSWHWMFLINIPIAVFLVIFGTIKINETTSVNTKPLDFTGSLLLGAGILAFMYGITNLNNAAFLGGILQLTVLPFLLSGALLFVIFLRFEKKVEKEGGDPIVAFSLLKGKKFQLTLLLGFLSGGFLAGIIFIPSYVQQVLQIPVEQAGYWLTPMAVASGIGAGVGGVLTDRYGAIKTVILAGIIGIIGFFLFPFIAGFSLFFVASTLAGIGLGILLGAPLNVLVGESAKHGEQGSALGTLSLIRQVGLTLFPTAYAGFITGAFVKVQPVLDKKYDSSLFNFSGGALEGNYEALVSQINKITDPTIQKEALKIVANVVEKGYSNVYIMAGTLAIIVTVIGIYLHAKQE
ncbi:MULTISPECIES: MFS transporter [unclassified Virgibacillus]|uniref:MFS transporter n=1 Tax=unclassified Virgibacillus TaxID=2620237 RepID=UPI0024DEAA2A|nr:MFS transporter [Virgibacillus sp. LDC-1]